MVANAFVRLLDTAPARVAARFGPSSRAARLVRPIIARLLPSGTTVVTVRGGAVRGARLLIYPQHEKFYWTGLHEPEVQDVLAEVLRPGGTCWDVGAHVGFFTALASRVVGPRGRVHAFEPMPESIARLEWTIAANELDNVELHAAAVGAEDGEALLFGQGSTLMASLDHSRATEQAFRVRCLTIDSLAAEFGVPDVIKVDVEGMELELLRGGAATFVEGRTTVVAELASSDREQAALKLLRGYTARRVSASNWLFEPRRAA